MKKTYCKIYFENDEGEYIEFKFDFRDNEEALSFGRGWFQSYVSGLPGHNWCYAVYDPNGKEIRHASN
jgi:hypothetical protein